MPHFARLVSSAGTWQGTYRLQVMPTDPIIECPTELTVTPVLRDTFLRLDQTWSWKGEPQSGSLLIGHDPKSDAATIHWIDTWHNGTTVMALTGTFAPDGTLIAHGHFAVPNSPDWGWRIEIRADAERLKVDMFCINPDTNGDEGWVWAEYHKRT